MPGGAPSGRRLEHPHGVERRHVAAPRRSLTARDRTVRRQTAPIGAHSTSTQPPVRQYSPSARLRKPFVHQVAAQRRRVGVEAGQDDVDLALGVPPPGLERCHQVLEYRRALASARRNPDQPAVDQERVQHGRELRVADAEVHRLAFRGAAAGGIGEDPRVHLETAVDHADEPTAHEPVQGRAHLGLAESGRRRDLGRRGRAEDDRRHDPQPLRRGQQTDDGLGGEPRRPAGHLPSWRRYRRDLAASVTVGLRTVGLRRPSAPSSPSGRRTSAGRVARSLSRSPGPTGIDGNLPR